MVLAKDLKSGMTFLNGEKTSPRYGSNVITNQVKGIQSLRMKLKDVTLRFTFDDTYRPEDKFEQAVIETVTAQYLYSMDGIANFMNNETYEQYEIPVEQVKDELLYVLENTDVKIQFYGTEVIGIQLPTTVVLEVTETQPSIKGATVTGSGKPATMETGLVVNVPDFVEAGTKLEINTQTGEYLKRA